MKRVLFAVLLLAVAAPVFAVARTVVIVDDVIKMSKAGVGDDEIIAYVQKTREPFDVTGDDVIAMTDAHVSRAVIKAVIDESASRMRDDRRESRSTVYVTRPYYDPYYYYDPFFYGPRVYFSFGFGPRYGYYGYHGGIRGGHFRHR